MNNKNNKKVKVYIIAIKEKPDWLVEQIKEITRILEESIYEVMIPEDEIYSINNAIRKADILLAITSLPSIEIGMQIAMAKDPILVVSEDGRDGVTARSLYVTKYGEYQKNYTFHYFTNPSQILGWFEEIRKKHFQHLPSEVIKI